MRHFWQKRYGVFCLAFLVFFSIAYMALDPDFGWHYQMGHIILSQGLPKTDQFSYTMPSFHPINHEWLAEVIIAFLFPFIGMAGLAALFSLLMVLTLILSLQSLKKIPWEWVNGVFLLSVASTAPSFGIRMQVFSWFFFALLFFIISHKNVWMKWRGSVPLLFILWVNLHGGFALGIVLLFLTLLLSHFRKQWERKDVLVIFLLSLLATCLNPYGIHIWQTVFDTVTSPLLKSSVAEWQSPILEPIYTYSLLIVMTLSGLSLFRYRKQFPLLQFILFVFLLIAALTSVRNVPLFILIALPTGVMGLDAFSQEVDKQKGGNKRLKKAYGVFLGVMIIVFLIDTSLSLYGAYTLGENCFYPEQSVKFLRTHESSGHIFSTYNWGGYVVWQLPGERVFITGMMPIWYRREEKEGESSYAFRDYTAIVSGKLPLRRAIQTYDIDTLLLPVTKPTKKQGLAAYITAIRQIFQRQTTEKLLEKEVQSLHWRVIYRDAVAVIYRKSS